MEYRANWKAFLRGNFLNFYTRTLKYLIRWLTSSLWPPNAGRRVRLAFPRLQRRFSTKIPSIFAPGKFLRIRADHQKREIKFLQFSNFNMCFFLNFSLLHPTFALDLAVKVRPAPADMAESPISHTALQNLVKTRSKIPIQKMPKKMSALAKGEKKK